MANPTPANTPLPDVPLGADIETTAWMQEVGANLNQILLDKGPPSLVTGLTATANSATIVLRWNAAQNASIYRIYRNTTGDFNSASIVNTVGASKTGVASLSAQDSQDQTQAQRFYWVQAVNERGLTGPQSQMVIVTNFTAAAGSTSLGVNAVASGTDSTALGTSAAATGTDSTALGVGASASATDAISLGANTRALSTNATALGTASTANNASAIAIGDSATASGSASIAIGKGVSVDSTNSLIIGTTGAITASAQATAVGNSVGIASSDQAVAIGYSVTVNASPNGIALGRSIQITNATNAIAIGNNAAATADYTLAIGAGAEATAAHQIMKGSFGFGSQAYYSQEVTVMSAAGSQFNNTCLAESTIMLSAAFTDTGIQIPAYSVVWGVTVFVSVTIPTAVTFDVGIAGATTRYGSGISAAAGSSHSGVEPGPLFYSAATSIRLTPNAMPSGTTGHVTVSIHYYTLTPASS